MELAPTSPPPVASPTATASRRTPDVTAPAPAPAPRFPWFTLAVLALLALVGSYLLVRRTPPRAPDRRR